jgi:Flp pilus assembly protein TadD
VQPNPQLAEALAAFQRGDLGHARQVAETALAASPSPQWNHILGLIHCRLGQPADGVPYLRAAWQADPANATFQVMLSRALVDSGQAEEALELPAPASATWPAELALLQARAEAADAAGKSEVAAQAWAELARARPQDWRALSNLGNALALLERWEEAADPLARAASLQPSDPMLRRNAGTALAKAGRMVEAEQHFRAATELDPTDGAAQMMLGWALTELKRFDEALAVLNAAKERLGDRAEIEMAIARSELGLVHFPEAEAAYRRVLEIEPANRDAFHELGLIHERTSRLDALSDMLDQAQAVGIGQDSLSYVWAVRARREGRLEEARALLMKSSPEDNAIGWYRLLAKIADAEGNWAEAFDATVAMNRAADDYDDWRYRTADFRAKLRSDTRLLQPRWVATLTQLPPAERTPAFLVGLPRSGTTLLDTFLMGHPGTAVLEELPLINAAQLALGAESRLPAPIPDLVRARTAYFDELAKRVPPGFDGLAVDKSPLNMLQGPLIHSLFPGARVIFAQRHPCDVVLSGFMQSFRASLGMANYLDLEDAADFYDAVMGFWTRTRELIPLEVHTIIYEDLVADPAATLRPLIEFLGLEWDERLLDHQQTAAARGTILTASYDQVVQPLNKRAVGRWRRYEKQLEPVLPVLLPWAERLGYTD